MNRFFVNIYNYVRDAYKWRKRKAPLYEAFEQSKTRYGKVVNIGEKRSRFPEHEFEFREIEISIIYINGSASMVWHTAERAIPEDFKRKCFEAYANEMEWYELPNKPTAVTSLFAYMPDLLQNRYWQRSDQKAWACLAQTGTIDDLEFHLDFTSGAWQRVKNVKYGIW